MYDIDPVMTQLLIGNKKPIQNYLFVWIFLIKQKFKTFNRIVYGNDSIAHV